MSAIVKKLRAEAVSEVSEELAAPITADELRCETCKTTVLRKDFSKHTDHVLVDYPKKRKESSVPLVDSGGHKIILAKDAVIGEKYLTVGAHYCIKIIEKLGSPEEGYVSSVTVESETSPYKPIAIAGGTELLSYNPDLHVPYTFPKEEGSTMSEKKASKTPKAEKASAEPKFKMSDIIVPMLLANKHTAEEIADAVIAKFPEKKAEREKLAQQIAGPRLYNLKKDKDTCKGKTPGLKEAPKKEAPKKEAPKKAPAKKADTKKEAAPTA
jgi:hypothetical protein